MTMELAERIAELRALPPMPRIAREIMAALESDDLSYTQLGSIIEQDPTLTAKIMGIANSAYFARARPVCSLDQAIATTGLKRVKTVALGLSMILRFNPKYCPSFDLTRYWYDANATAWAAEQLAARDGRAGVTPGCAQLAGMLRNIGMPALTQVAGEEMAGAFGYAATNPQVGLREFEQTVIGIDHHQASAILLEEWGLPPGMIAVARHSEDPGYQGEYHEFVRLIGAAVAWKRSGFETFPQEMLSLSREDLEDLAPRALKEHERILAEAQAIA